MKTINIIISVAVALLVGGCGKSSAPSANNSGNQTPASPPAASTPTISERTEPPKPAKQQQPTLPPLDQEAVALTEKTFSEWWTHVGDSWFILQQDHVGSSQASTFIQFKDVTFQARSKVLSEADTLNGLQWQGEVEAFDHLKRNYSLNEPPVRQWSDWNDGGRMVLNGNFTIYRLTKKNGQWSIIGSPNRRDQNPNVYTMFTKPSEEQIKSILNPSANSSGNQPPATIQADPKQAGNECRKNLQKLVDASMQWAVENKKNTSDIPTESDLARYFPGGIPKCPAGGVYTLKRLDSDPTCSIAGHGVNYSSGDCLSNLRLLDGAKQQWALQNRKKHTDIPTEGDLSPYLKDGMPKCPNGGAYSLNQMDMAPSCSVPGHEIK